MKATTSKATSQAFPARRTRVVSFESLPISFGDTQVAFNQCSQDFADVLTEALINFRPRRFLIVDPPDNISIDIKGNVVSTSAVPLADSSYAVTVELQLEAYQPNKVLLASGRASTMPQTGMSSPKNPETLFSLLRGAISAALQVAVAQLTNTPNLNTAPWQSKVEAIDGQDILISPGGLDDNVVPGNLFDVGRRLDEGVSYIIAVIEVLSVGPDIAVCRYFGQPEEQAQINDAVFIHP